MPRGTAAGKNHNGGQVMTGRFYLEEYNELIILDDEGRLDDFEKRRLEQLKQQIEKALANAPINDNAKEVCYCHTANGIKPDCACHCHKTERTEQDKRIYQLILKHWGDFADYNILIKNAKQNEQIVQRLRESFKNYRPHQSIPAGLIKQLLGDCKHYDREEINPTTSTTQLRCKTCGKILGENK
jgi:hypothetical protein